MFRDTAATIRKLQALRERGVRIAIDDFGTGYSSLSYLRRFPVDILKIAKDFIGSPDGDPGEWAFAAAIVALGRALDLRVVAEGIEHDGQLERLRELGCEFGQGYLFARPGPIEGLASVLGLTGGRDRRGQRQADGRAPADPPFDASPRRRAPDVHPLRRRHRPGHRASSSAAGRPGWRRSSSAGAGWPSSASRSRWSCSRRPSPSRSAALGVPIYVGSTALVLAALLRNISIAGLWIVAVGAFSNMAAIATNGGYMPADPGALASLGRTPETVYSNSSVVAHPALQPLTDIFAIPARHPVRQRVQRRRRPDRPGRGGGDRGGDETDPIRPAIRTESTSPDRSSAAS